MDAWPSPTELKPGQTVGNYKILALLGEGGMGTVYRAEHVMLRKAVALKFIKPELISDGDALRRFAEEARLVAGLDNEHIIQVTDFGRDPVPFFAMELLDGESLAQRLGRERGNRLQLEAALDIVRQIAVGLGAVHALGVFHRDLKPENVYLAKKSGRPDFVKILDFGIAKLAPAKQEPGKPRMTKTGAILGTPAYMAPEQIRGDASFKTDIYALGVLFFQMLTGRVPFDAEEWFGVLAMHLQQPFPAATDTIQDLPPDIDMILARATAKKPDDRYDSMEAFAEAIAELQARLPPVGGHTPSRVPAVIPTRVHPTPPRQVFAQPSVQRVAPQAPTEGSWLGRNALKIVAGLVGLGLVVAVVVLLMERQQRRGEGGGQAGGTPPTALDAGTIVAALPEPADAAVAKPEVIEPPPEPPKPDAAVTTPTTLPPPEPEVPKVDPKKGPNKGRKDAKKGEPKKGEKGKPQRLIVPVTPPPAEPSTPPAELQKQANAAYAQGNYALAAMLGRQLSRRWPVPGWTVVVKSECMRSNTLAAQVAFLVFKRVTANDGDGEMVQGALRGICRGKGITLN